MRHQYTPIFREITTSSIWAKTPAERCVWFYLMLHADPEGFVPGTIPGLAVAAHVSLDDARDAVGSFLAPDPDSNTQEFEGRRLEKVPHGWRILNFVYWRELAKREAEKARKRNWAHQKRNAEPRDGEADVDMSTCVDDRSETVDAPKPKPKPPSSSSSSPTGLPEPTESRPLVIRELPADMTIPDWLVAEARVAGVEDPAHWFDKLKEGPIGGERGVLPAQLDAYLRRLVGQWRSYEEIERSKKAQRAAGSAPQRRFATSDVPAEDFEPEPHHEAFARRQGLDLEALRKGVLADHPGPLAPPLSRSGVLGERLTVAAKQKKLGHPVTGKLTREQYAAWGPVPVGGAIPKEGP